ENGFAYIPISKLSPLASQLIATRELFGLRPPLHTVVRMLNPLSAPLSLMGVFHPNFATIHQQAAQMLGLKRALICKGEGGEFERIPDRTAELNGLSNGKIWLESWPNLSKPGLQTKQQRLNLNHYRSVWDGEIDDHYGRLAVTGTLALVIRALGLVEEPVEAHRMAETWWQTRHQADAVFEAAS
ncbi:MAG: hypothetical protein ABW125_16315, partial [Candidatus Thiodiazotropha lotti]